MLVPPGLLRGSHSTLPGGEEFFPRGSVPYYLLPVSQQSPGEELSTRGCGGVLKMEIQSGS